MKAQGRAAGATGWLVKPFNPERLLATIAKVFLLDLAGLTGVWRSLSLSI